MSLKSRRKGPSVTELVDAERQLEFLYTVMAALNDRRTAMDQRATAIVTIALAELGILLSQLDTFFGAFSNLVKGLLLVASVVMAFIGLIQAARVILPVSPKPGHLADPANPRLTWFVSIAQQTAAEYEGVIRESDLSDLVRVMSLQVSEVSYVLKGRYFKLMVAGRALVISTFAIGGGATLNALLPFIPWLGFLAS